MRLEAFQIIKCFGFIDSGEIDLSAPGNLVYFLGRNSSGKTSVLRAISHFEHGQVPAQHPNFENYERTEGLSFARGWFSVDSSGGERLSVDALVRDVVQRLRSTPLEIQQDEESFSVFPTNLRSAPRAVQFLDGVNEFYTDLVKRILAPPERTSQSERRFSTS
jgi:hypothetical protein